MHIHLPKIIHGWREFAKEIAIIVIGVLIALGFEQVVEELHWRHKVAEGEERLRAEARDNFIAAAEQIRLSACTQAQYDRLIDRIANSGDRLDPAPRGDLSGNYRFFKSRGRVITTLFNSANLAVWRELEQDGTTLHMAPERHRLYTRMYNLAEIYNEQMTQGYFPPETLAFAVPLDPAARVDLMIRVDDNARRYANMQNRGLQMMNVMRELAIAPEASDVDQALEGDFGRASESVWAFCKAHNLPLVDWKKAHSAALLVKS